MLRVGVDMIEIARVERSIQRFGERFYRRFFTDAERAQWEGKPSSLAARIAAKEAVAKALGTGIGDVRWVEIEIDTDTRGRPLLRLHGNALHVAQTLGAMAWDVSLSHTDGMALALVVMTG